MAAFDRLNQLWVARQGRGNVRGMENAALERMERLLEMLAVHATRVDERLEMLAAHAASVDGRLEMLAAHATSVDGRLESMEQRLGSLERGQEALRIELRERFESLDEHIRTVAAAVRLQDARYAVRLESIDLRIGGYEQHMGRTMDRLDSIDADYLQVIRRLDVLSDDIKQRFRVVNDRLATPV